MASVLPNSRETSAGASSTDCKVYEARFRIQSEKPHRAGTASLTLGSTAWHNTAKVPPECGQDPFQCFEHLPLHFALGICVTDPFQQIFWTIWLRASLLSRCEGMEPSAHIPETIGSIPRLPRLLVDPGLMPRKDKISKEDS